ncbi:unnamed protein product [Cuscuta campestris]|uniref:RNase H type-1 domain-containing protein n=1 Tax=Cuscuta campestris TaxID=132261 RepID=A0A484L371_9ASTE|nr:unnamed protein product [Cuscuta campestris]
MPFLPGMFPFALPGAGTMPLQAPMAVTSFQTPMPQPSPFQPQLVSTMAPVNLAGALNAAGPSRPPQATDPQITPDGHCVSIESDDGEWDIPRAHKKKKGKTIRPATSRNSAFERLGDREEGQRKSAKLRLGQSIAHVNGFARLGEGMEAKPARTQCSRSNRREPARTRASRQEEEAESQPRLPMANRLTIPNDRVQQMEAKLERLEKKVGEKNDRDKPLAGSPFTTRVHLTPFPRKVKIDAPRFTGKEDPEIQLDSFNQSATMNARQRESENLTQFLTRWKEEVDKVEEMDDETVLSLLLNGLRAGNYTRSSAGNPQPRTKRPTILHGSLLKLKPSSEQRKKLSMVTSPSRCKSRRKKHRDLAGRGTTMIRSSEWSIRRNAKKSGKHRSFFRQTLPVKQGGNGRAPIVRTTEYEALAGGLRLAQALKVSRVSIKSDSSLVVGQVAGNMEVREGRMAHYKDLVLALLKGFEEFKIAQIPRAENADADLLSKLTQYAPEHVSKRARVEILYRASIEKLEVAAITAANQFDRSNLVGADDHWMYDLMEYLIDGSLPEQDDRARKVKLRAPRFQVLDGKL